MASFVKMKDLKSSSEEGSSKGGTKQNTHIKGPIWLQVKASWLWLLTGSHWPNSPIQIQWFLDFGSLSAWRRVETHGLLSHGCRCSFHRTLPVTRTTHVSGG